MNNQTPNGSISTTVACLSSKGFTRWTETDSLSVPGRQADRDPQLFQLRSEVNLFSQFLFGSILGNERHS